MTQSGADPYRETVVVSEPPQPDKRSNNAVSCKPAASAEDAETGGLEATAETVGQGACTVTFGRPKGGRPPPIGAIVSSRMRRSAPSRNDDGVNLEPEPP